MRCMRLEFSRGWPLMVYCDVCKEELHSLEEIAEHLYRHAELDDWPMKKHKMRRNPDGRFNLLENRLCQSCCPFDIMGWREDNQIVCNYCHIVRGRSGEIWLAIIFGIIIIMSIRHFVASAPKVLALSIGDNTLNAIDKDTFNLIYPLINLHGGQSYQIRDRF